MNRGQTISAVVLSIAVLAGAGAWTYVEWTAKTPTQITADKDLAAAKAMSARLDAVSRAPP